jgi:hypothetical protein
MLLPQDFDPSHSGSADDMISDSWISGYARGCEARHVIILIDACREGAHPALAPSKSVGAEDDAPLINRYVDQATDGPAIAFLYSCAANKQSGPDSQGENCSAFTRAFAEAIELENGPAELKAVAAEAARRLVISSAGQQVLVSSGRDGRGRQWEGLITKEDEAARFRERLRRSDWSHRLAQTELFQSLKSNLPTFATQLQALALRAEEQVAEARRVLPSQHWREQHAWFRQAACIRHIFLSADGAEVVPPAEIAVLLAVPFVYEAALAAAEIQLVAAGAMPDPEATSTSGYLVGAWRHAWRESDAAQARRAMIARNRQDAAADHSCWSLVTFCHASGELWDVQGGSQDRTGWALDAVTTLVTPAPLPEVANDHRVCQILSAPRLLRLARLMFAGFDEVTLDVTQGNQPLDKQFPAGEFDNQLTINELRLAHLLNLGSQLALDPRRMPPVLAEHVGTDEVLSADWIRSQLARAEWQTRVTSGVAGGQGERWFDLKLDCANDAIDAALLAVVDALESYKTRLLQRQDDHAKAMRDLLPAGFTVDRLNGGPSGWRPTRPPLRFELDRTRIIGLLMGQQLYGERWPALRELYQNALDACRYRRAAEQLATHERRNRAGRAYQGRIAISFGVDGRRRFVECVDDGIGMADRHIRRLFAFAGQRFAHSHEFHIDRARWDQEKIKFFPNSRFGVGVLSYFMLAEELDIASRRWARPNDLAPPSVHARIIGSGSLFRLETTIDPTRLKDDYGTSVRLYLREDAPENDALTKSILSWLGLPEVLVTISADAQDEIELAAGKPTNRLRELAGGVLLPIEGSEGTTGSPRVYIAPEPSRGHDYALPSDNNGNQLRGFALVDGILTRLGGEPWPNCLVVNLTEDLLANLTVDRRQVDPPAKTVESVLDWTREKGGAALATWSTPEFFALHEILMELDPKVLTCADAIMRETAPPEMIIRTRFLQADRIDALGREMERPDAITPLQAGWSLSVGLSDLDPEILLELLLSIDALDGGPLEYTRALDYRRTFARIRERLSLRATSDSSLDPVIIQGMFHRTKELADAGLVLPNWLQHAVSFETYDEASIFPAAYRPVVAALDAQRQVGLEAHWTSGTRDPVVDAEVSTWSAEALSRLNRKQLILISRDLDGVSPFVTDISTTHFLKFSHHRETPSEAVKIARSFADLGIGHLIRVPLSNDAAIAAIAGMAEVPITENAWTFVERLSHACRHHRPASVWDLALAATAARIEPVMLGPVLDLLEADGGDVARCREFLASCPKAAVPRVRRRRSRNGGQGGNHVEAP